MPTEVQVEICLQYWFGDLSPLFISIQTLFLSIQILFLSIVHALSEEFDVLHEAKKILNIGFLVVAQVS